jgi:hypothetical protein
MKSYYYLSSRLKKSEGVIQSQFVLRFFIFFREHTGELRVIVLSLKGENVIQFMRETGPENHTHDAFRHTTHSHTNTHGKHTHLTQTAGQEGAGSRHKT